MDRRLITFNRRNDEALGELIQRLLRARAELARLAASEQTKPGAREKAEAEAREAEEDYADYSRQHEELRREVPFPSLNDDEERDLKAIYRKACSLCHPDKFPEGQKEAATKVFVDLQAAYKSNDLNRVREIHALLEANGLPETRSTTLREVDKLKVAIAELEHAITRLAADIVALHSSDAYRHLEAAGVTEADWQDFFTRQRAVLEVELAKVESQILAYRKGAEGSINLAEEA